ncbi:MAG TPA: hypothetical protein VNC13_08860 [Propionibacteriaceae bacterium]|jgi:hypothetical protein|nr:hypothetical protein [Propionibacteriaceae bacterium]
MSLRSSRAESPWAIGITVFAAAKIMAGGCQFFAIVLIAIDVLVIWALASTGQAAAARS